MSVPKFSKREKLKTDYLKLKYITPNINKIISILTLSFFYF